MDQNSSGVNIHPDSFMRYGKDIMKTNCCYTLLRKFRSFFGISPIVCSNAYNKISKDPDFPKQTKPYHLLWALMFLKLYSTESIVAGIAGCSEKTFRKWSWTMLNLLDRLEFELVCQTSVVTMRYALRYQLTHSIVVLKIDWSSRLEQEYNLVYPNGTVVYATVDGTDFRIQEPTPFSKRWYSHKFNGPGLRYEVAISIDKDGILWTNGPFPAGQYPDIKIFRQALRSLLEPNEKVIADKGYIGEPDDVVIHRDDMNSLYRARHETCNKRFKQFNILKNVFRHDLEKHGIVFHCVAVLTQLSLQWGEELFEVEETIPDVP